VNATYVHCDVHNTILFVLNFNLVSFMGLQY